MQTPQFYQEGDEISKEKNNLILMPAEGPLAQDASDMSHPNSKEKCLDPATL